MTYSKSLWSYNPIPRGCVYYAPFFGLRGPVFKDVGPIGHESTITGTTRAGNGALILDGDDDVELTNVLTRSLATTTKGTWLAWVYFDDVIPAADTEIISFGDTSANAFIGLRLKASGLFEAVALVTAETKFLVDTDSAPFTVATWHRVGLVQDGTSPVLYIGGVAPSQAFSITTDKGWWFAGDSSLDNGYIGAGSIAGAGKARFLSGRVREVTISIVDLSADEMLYDYQRTRGFV